MGKKRTKSRDEPVPLYKEVLQTDRAMPGTGGGKGKVITRPNGNRERVRKERLKKGENLGENRRIYRKDETQKWVPAEKKRMMTGGGGDGHGKKNKKKKKQNVEKKKLLVLKKGK